MQPLTITNKLTYLKDNYPFEEIPALTDTKRCIHCNAVFEVKDYKVFKDKSGEEYICCPNAPECNGTVIDWFDVE
jgi:hypothetical protein